MPRQRSRSHPATTDFRTELEASKRQSTLQLLFKAARLLNEEALARVAALPGRPALRPSHSSLFPHIDLDGTRIVDLASRLGVTKQAVSQLVAELEDFGLVSRTPDPEDRRAKRVVLTERGREGFLDGLSVLMDIEDELAREIGRGRMNELRRALVSVLDRVEGAE